MAFIEKHFNLILAHNIFIYFLKTWPFLFLFVNQYAILFDLKLSSTTFKNQLVMFLKCLNSLEDLNIDSEFSGLVIMSSISVLGGTDSDSVETG